MSEIVSENIQEPTVTSDVLESISDPKKDDDLSNFSGSFHGDLKTIEKPDRDSSLEGEENGQPAMESFKCVACKKSFPGKRQLEIHVCISVPKAHFNCNEYNMSVCSVKKDDESSPVDSPSAAESQPGAFQCKVCKQTFFYQRSIEKHTCPVLSVERNQCPSCLEFFASKETLEEHIECHYEAPFRCQLCFEMHSAESELHVHLLLTHCSENIPFICPFCKENFDSQVSLSEHLPLHIDSRPVRCKVCENYFSKKESLLNHPCLTLCLKNQPFSCTICRKLYTEGRKLRDHMMIHTGERPYRCDSCLKGFHNSYNLTVHKRLHSTEFQCHVCGKTHTSRHTLADHLRGHSGEKTFFCEVCHRSFKTKLSLVEHMRSHTGEKPYKCNICSSSFARKGYFKEHMKIHAGVKSYFCDACGKGISNKSHFQIHLRMHTGEKPFECNVCQKTFSSKTRLSKHSTVHSQERRYQCDLCDKDFKHSSSLRYHKMKFHKSNQSGDKKVAQLQSENSQD